MDALAWKCFSTERRKTGCTQESFWIKYERGVAPEKLRNLHFEVLIALTARSHGARLVISDRVDFELTSSYTAAKGLSLEIW